MSTAHRPAVTPQAVVGVSICLAGIALTLDNLGFFELRSFVELWPVVPISIGVLTLMYGESRQEWVKGALWLALGLFFIFRHPLMHDVWPLALVALGGYLVWRARSGPPPARKWETEVPWQDEMETAVPPPPSRPGPGGPPLPPGYHPPAQPSWTPYTAAPAPDPSSSAQASQAPPSYADTDVPPLTPPPIPPPIPPGAGRRAGRGGFGGRSCSFGSRTPPPAPPGVTAARDEFSAAGFTAGAAKGQGQRPSLFALMSGIRRQVVGGFAGAEATAIMGGIELDLRYSAMDGDEVVIDTFALWGGIEIWVPANWHVVSQGLPLMGGFEDKTHITVHGRQPRLVVRGVAIMGGVEIKN